MLTVKDPWAKEVENTKGHYRIVTADKMDEGQGSTEKVEKTSELQEACLDFTRRWISCWRHWTGSRLGRAPLGQRIVAGGPLQEGCWWGRRPLEARGLRFRQGRRCGCVRPRFGGQRPAWGRVRLQGRGLLGGRRAAKEMKYRATELHREQDWRRPCVLLERPSSGRRLRRMPWRRPPWHSCELSGVVHQAC